MKKVIIENEKLILEINRINQLIGQKLIVEGVAKTLVDFLEEAIPTFKKPLTTQVDNIVNNQTVIETLGNIIDRVNTKVRNARTTGSPLPFSNVAQDLYVLAQRDNDFLIKVTDYIMTTPNGKGIRTTIDNVLTGVDQSKNKSEIISDIRDKIDQGFAANNIPEGPYTKMIKDRAALDYEYNMKYPKPSSFSNLLGKIPIRDAKILSSMMYDAFLPLMAKQSKFVDLSNKAAKYMKETDEVPTEYLDEMLSILASTKKYLKQQPRIVLNEWKRQLKNDPNSRVSQEALDELDIYIQSGKGKEIWDEVAKTDPATFYPMWDKWKKLWPFKKPKSPNGVWIFNDALATKEYWERVIMTILFKTPETFKDWYKFLNNQGMTRGVTRILFTKIITMFFVLPTLETLLKTLASITERAYNLFADPDVNWVDYTNLGDEWTGNMSDNIYSQIKNQEWGKFIDDRTYADEFAYIIVDIAELIWNAENFKGFGEAQKRIEREIENMTGVTQEVRDAIRNGRAPKTGKTSGGVKRKGK
jgi:hypothetical protein